MAHTLLFVPLSNHNMGFRISSAKSDRGITVRIEGRLDAAAVPDLRVECLLAEAPLRLDLSGLLSADADGVRALQGFSEANAELVGMSPYIRHLVIGDGGAGEDRQ